MGALVFSGVLIIIGLLLYFSKYKGYILHYLLFWVCFAPLLYHLFIGFGEEIEYFEMIQWAKYLGLFIFIISVFKNRGEQFSILYLLLAIVFVYALFLGLIRGTSIFSSVKFVFGSFFELMVFMGIYNTPIKRKSLLRFIRLILWIEIVCVFIEALTGFSFYPQPDDIRVRITGSFYNSNLCAEFLSVLLFVIIYLDAKKEGRISAKNWVLFIIISIIVFYSGIRMALLCHALIGFLFVYSIYKDRVNKRTLIASGVIIAGVIFIASKYWLSNADVTYDSEVTSAAQRQNVLASVFLQEGYLNEQTTMYYTVFVLSYFPDNPIFGPGLLFQSPAGYGGVVSVEEANLTDCTLALRICETGLIGVLLFFLIYYNVLRKLCGNSKGARLVFYFMLIVTITDPGIFFLGNYLGFISLVLIEKKDELSQRRLKKVL